MSTNDSLNPKISHDKISTNLNFMEDDNGSISGT